ncbi:MAG: hypothetical protein HY855_03920 [Burkholderiales bacterium]|nr:hypothetical protein [Burkholderiales bacterium]
MLPERRTAQGGAGDSPPPLRPPPEASPRSGAATDGALSPVPAARESRDPREQCGGRMLLALHKCLVRECSKPQYFDHPECVQARAIEERARALGSP